MNVEAYPDSESAAAAMAARAATRLRQAQADNKTARLLLGSAAWLGPALEQLARAPGINWSAIELFQIEEFVGLAAVHPASSRKFLCDRIVGPARVGRYHLLDAGENAERACRDAGHALAAAPIDLAVVGLGPKGEIAHHAGPADFSSETPYLIVRLDDASRRELGGHPGFEGSAPVPDRVIVVGLRQLLKSRSILAVTAPAVADDGGRRFSGGPVSPLVPASILQTHPDVTVIEVRAPRPAPP